MILYNPAQSILPPLRALCALCVKTHIQPRPGVSLQFAANPRRMNTSAKRTLNPCRMNTSKTQHLKSFRIRTYKKTGEGGPGSSSPESRKDGLYPEGHGDEGIPPRSFCRYLFTPLRPSLSTKDFIAFAAKKKEVPSSRRTPLSLQGVEKRATWAWRRLAWPHCASCCIYFSMPRSVLC